VALVALAVVVKADNKTQAHLGLLVQAVVEAEEGLLHQPTITLVALGEVV
jgi:hypothetical protein